MTTSPVISVTDELIAELKSVAHTGKGEFMIECAQVYALLAERAELKRDAERYRFARHLDNDCFMLNTLQRVSGEELDAAIDAAMQSEAKP